jgi:hypothetical protein
LSALYKWPAATRVDRLIPKERLYVEAGVTSNVKQRFVDEVKRIRWAYKLGEESLRLKGSEAVPEIQVFEIELKGRDLSDTVLTAIDKAIPSPIVFEKVRSTGGQRDEVEVVAAHKAPGARGPKLSSYLHSDWQPAQTPRSPLPSAIDLTALYAQLLANLMPLQARPGESLSDAATRLDKTRALERDITTLERKIRTEPQLNRKIELRRSLKAVQATLEDLKK